MAEQNRAKGTVAKVAKMGEFAHETGEGKYAAGKDDRGVVQQQNNLPDQGQLPGRLREQLSLRWQRYLPALVETVNPQCSQGTQALGQRSIVQKPGGSVIEL
jgi:hypothetical protein